MVGLNNCNGAPARLVSRSRFRSLDSNGTIKRGERAPACDARPLRSAAWECRAHLRSLSETAHRVRRPAFAYRTALRHVPIAALTRTDRQVLRALADHEQPDRGCWPARETIAAQEGLNVRTVERSLGRLETRGLILRERCSVQLRAVLKARGVLGARACHDARSGGSHYALNYAALRALLPSNVRPSVLADLDAAESRQPADVRRRLARARNDGTWCRVVQLPETISGN